MEENIQNQMQQQADKGRSTDSVLGHLSLGEIVIPRAFLDDPDVMNMLEALFEQAGSNLAEFTVGDPANKVNPETGNPEFFSFKSLFKSALPILGAIAGNYFLPGIGGALGSSLFSGAGGAALASGLGGAAGGALSGGGLRGALIGGGAGALGGYAGAGGFGSLPGGALQGATRSGAPLSGVGEGSGVLGGLGRALGINSGSSAANLVGGGSSFGGLGTLASAAGGLQTESALNKIKNEQLGANNRQLANLESFDPSGIENDPGYKFNLEQGQKGLNAALGGQGSLFSGRALKAASEYNQKYADNAFKDYYNRWLQKVSGQNQLYGAGGDINANATLARSNNLNQSLSNIFGSRVGDYGGQLDLLKALGLGASYA